ncbi:DNA adenine methylase [Brevundimonas sp. 2R-24]|uniref:site-specific DNA-methyltransferase (adenine-specific) n=1 Tax=Peiella sedimenti TaxID=3061083 RepID=A0ABT8SJ48_9CAUL|nr:DNA adenine methylase [Caulobacteraceae bacterium XZ-24]
MIKYIGSKRALIAPLMSVVGQILPEQGRVCDLFSGSARVGHALKALGHQVHANDHNAFAHVLATALVQADKERWSAPAAKVLAELSALKPEPGWFTRTFCEEARFFTPENGARIDAMRERIAALALEPELEAIALASLIRAADRVDSTAGVQMAFMKRWAPRALKPLELRLPEMAPGVGARCLATCADAEAVAAEVEADLVYLDPPYNQHSYLGNYHVWESLVRWDKPEVYGVARKRLDVRERKSAFNSRKGILPALERVIGELSAPRLIVSFNDEGFVTREDMERILLATGRAVRVVELPHSRYVGARIGIHNPKGEKVGRVGRLTNVERLFIALDPALEPRLAA